MARPCPFFRGKGPDRQGVNSALHPVTERRIYHPVPFQHPLAGKGSANDYRLEMRTVASDIRLCAGQPRLNEFLDIRCFHRQI